MKTMLMCLSTLLIAGCASTPSRFDIREAQIKEAYDNKQIDFKEYNAQMNEIESLRLEEERIHKENLARGLQNYNRQRNAKKTIYDKSGNKVGEIK
jgi:hypothetical protein